MSRSVQHQSVGHSFLALLPLLFSVFCLLWEGRTSVRPYTSF